MREMRAIRGGAAARAVTVLPGAADTGGRTGPQYAK